MRKRARMLALHRIIARFALAAANILAWVIAFRIFHLLVGDLELALAGTAGLYALSQGITFILTPLSGMALRKGVHRALTYGTLAAAVAFGSLSALFFQVSFSNEYAFTVVSLFAVFVGIHRALYWVPYKTAEIEGIRQSPHKIAQEAAIALMPALAGYAITSWDATGWFLLIVTGFLCVSALFAAHTVRKYESFSWNYSGTMREFFARRNSAPVGLFLLDGMQGAALLFIWPLAAFLVLGENFQSLGAILTATLCITFLARYLIRKGLRAFRIHQSPLVLATIVFSSWIVRLAAGTPVQLLAVDVYYHSGNAPRRFSIDSYSHDQLADGGHYVDEYTAIKEMGLAFGRFLAAALFILLLLTTNEALAFAACLVLAAIASAWSVFLAHRLNKTAY